MKTALTLVGLAAGVILGTGIWMWASPEIAPLEIEECRNYRDLCRYLATCEPGPLGITGKGDTLVVVFEDGSVKTVTPKLEAILVDEGRGYRWIPVTGEKP